MSACHIGSMWLGTRSKACRTHIPGGLHGPYQHTRLLVRVAAAWCVAQQWKHELRMAYLVARMLQRDQARARQQLRYFGAHCLQRRQLVGLAADDQRWRGDRLEQLVIAALWLKHLARLPAKASHSL